MENNLKQIRKEAGCTQEQLASSIQVSTQEIQRIESQIQSVRFEIAYKLSQFLQEPIELLFPTIKKIPSWKKKTWDLNIYTNHDLSEQLEKVGFDVDACFHRVSLSLRSGHEFIHQLCSHNKNLLWGKVQTDPHTGNFVVYDTKTERIALNLNHLIYSHFKFEPRYDFKDDEKLDDKNVTVHFAEQNLVLNLSVDPDMEWDDDDPPEWPESQLGDLFYYAELSIGEIDEVIMIKDMDGETAFLPMKEIAMVSVPLIYIEPELLSAISVDKEEESIA
jgi:DNA-binding XRE family transcriptional regulator